MANPTTTPTPIPTTPNVLRTDGSYQVVVLNRANEVTRVIYFSPHYAAALGYLSRNHKRRPWLDMVKDGQFVDWTLTPRLLDTSPDMAVAR